MKTKKTKSLTLAVFTALTVCGCAIFDLRDGEVPDAPSAGDDPLNISDILSIAGDAVVDMDYREYFTENVEFVDHRMIPLSGRERVVEMLETLRSRASHVEWQFDKANVRPDINVRFLDNMPYTVSRDGVEICRGTADFKIEMGSDWRISYWEDRPNAQQQPFFEF